MTMRVKMILPALQEAESPYWRPIKYALFPPLGLATLAAYFSEDDDVEIQDQHVEPLTLDDEPDLVCIQVYVTNAYRAYAKGRHTWLLYQKSKYSLQAVLFCDGRRAYEK